jgi:AhpD family alkylhydroperoxidase
MTARLNPYAEDLALVQPLIDYGNTVARMGLEKTLVELVKIRASQINGCAVCLHMHTEEALRSGENPMRLHMLDAWRESPLYTARERAALGWTDALTRLAETHAPDEEYAAVKAQFTKEEQVALTLMIGVINSFNKLGVGFRVSHPAANERRSA